MLFSRYLKNLSPVGPKEDTPECFGYIVERLFIDISFSGARSHTGNACRFETTLYAMWIQWVDSALVQEPSLRCKSHLEA